MRGAVLKTVLSLWVFSLLLVACSEKPPNKPDRGQTIPSPQSSVASSPSSATSSTGEPGECAGSLQSKINAAPPGGTVAADACVYREKVIIDKPITLEGGGKAEIRGSEVWKPSTFLARADGSWAAPDYPRVGGSVVECEPGTSRCHWPEQVFYDGQPLTQVAPSTRPKGMQFAVNSNRVLIVGADPAGRLVEVTMRDGWLTGAQGANGVTVRGFTMKHATDYGVWNGTRPNWTIEDSDLSWAHHANLRLTQSSGLVVRNVRSHHGGQAGMFGTGSRGLKVLGGEYDHNNTEDFLSSFSSAGIKVSAATGTVIDGVESDYNAGNGLWFDSPNRDQLSMVMSNNRVHHNERHGIKCEVTLYCQIFSNVVYENGGTRGGGGITANGSSHLHIHDNVLAWNANGIRIMNPLRTDQHPDEDYYNYVRNNEVFSNTIVSQDGRGRYALGWFNQWSGGNIYNTAANNRGHDNRYYYTKPEGTNLRYRWISTYDRLAQFNATPGEENARYMTESEKNDVLAAGRVPPSPEH